MAQVYIAMVLTVITNCDIYNKKARNWIHPSLSQLFPRWGIAIVNNTIYNSEITDLKYIINEANAEVVYMLVGQHR
jgi:hypothetical protein